jgi:hypothetical protein
MIADRILNTRHSSESWNPAKTNHPAQRTKPCCPASPEHFDQCAGFQLSLE